ncbi:MAG TPA: alpha/beta hydrolase [Micromonosporaceae bacterium]
MSTFVLIHGGGDVGWYWHLVEAELRAHGHHVVAPDLPCEDDRAGLVEYTDTVMDAIGDRTNLVVVGQSFGGFIAPLVADRVPVDVLVLVAGMIPAPGESPVEWWENTGYWNARQDQPDPEDGVDDLYFRYYHDVPRALATEAMSRSRRQSEARMGEPWPLDAWPDVPTKFVLCTEDRAFPPDFVRRVVSERLGIVLDEIDAGHCVALSRPKELARMLEQYTE